MSSMTPVFDRTFLVLTALLIVVGLFSFFSGAFFLFSNNSAIFWSTIIRHVGLGILGGVTGYALLRFVRAQGLAKAAPYIAIGTIVLTGLVFVPGIGSDLGTTAMRWVSIGGVSTQPAEFLKIGAVLGAAWWFSARREHISSLRFGLVPFWCFLGVIGGVLLLQPDTDGFLVLAVALTALYIYAGAPARHILLSFIMIIFLGIGLLFARPYLRDRVRTFINPAQDVLGTSYQVRQSMIAIGAGGVTGRGYGKGIHKYEYLPEPMGDALFAVIGEEWGIMGTASVVVLFFLWYVRVLVLSSRVTSFFSRFVIFGFAHVVIVQAYINILSNIGLFPFSGLPLPFMSQGGTALFVLMMTIGIIALLANTGSAKTGRHQ